MKALGKKPSPEFLGNYFGSLNILYGLLPYHTVGHLS